MEDKDPFILFIVGGVVAILLFFAISSAILKAFKPADTLQNTKPTEVDLDAQKRQEELHRQRMEEIKEQQEQLIEKQKQTLRDHRRLH